MIDIKVLSFQDAMGNLERDKILEEEIVEKSATKFTYYIVKFRYIYKGICL